MCENDNRGGGESIARSHSLSLCFSCSQRLCRLNVMSGCSNGSSFSSQKHCEQSSDSVSEIGMDSLCVSFDLSGRCSGLHELE